MARVTICYSTSFYVGYISVMNFNAGQARQKTKPLYFRGKQNQRLPGFASWIETDPSMKQHNLPGTAETTRPSFQSIFRAFLCSLKYSTLLFCLKT